jgi:hypothetical protein
MQRVVTPRCSPLAPHALPRRAAAPRVRTAQRIAAAPRRSVTLRAAEKAQVSADDLTPAGCERIRVSLKKPLGLVLEQNRTSGDIFVVEVLPDCSAAKDGRIAVGDQLIATSAIVYAKTEDYGGVSVKKGMQMVRLLVKGEKFDTGACHGWGAACAALTRLRFRSDERDRDAPGHAACDAGHPEVQDAEGAAGGGIAFALNNRQKMD